MGGQFLAEGFHAHNVAFLELAVVLGVLLHGIVCQVHIDLVKLLPGQVILFTGRSHVGFLEQVELCIVIDQCPDANVKFPSTEKQGCLDVLLDDERRILDLLDTCTGRLLLLWVRILLILSDLV